MKDRLFAGFARDVATTLRVPALVLALAWPVSTPAAGLEWIDAPDGVPLCLFEAGREDGPPLVLIHGFSQSHAVFKRQFQSSLAEDFRLIAFDLRGHGCSGKPWLESAYVDSATWAADVRAVLEARHVHEPIIIGWSFGAYVVADYVRAYGTRDLAGAILVGSTAGLLPAERDEFAKRQSDYVAPVPPPAELELERSIRNARSFVGMMSHAPLPADMKEIMFVANQQLPEYARRALIKRRFQNEDLVDRFDVPTLFLAGAMDRSNAPEVIQSVATGLPHARAGSIAGTGHSPFAEDPEQFNAEVRGFAAAVSPSSRAAAPASR